MFKISFFILIILLGVYIIFFLLGILFCFVYAKLATRKKNIINIKLKSEVNSVDLQIGRNIKQKLILAITGFFWYQTLRIGKIPSHVIRLFLYKRVLGMKIGQDVVIYGGAEIRNPWSISIGDGSIIGNDSKLDGRKGIIIGKNVNFSTGVWIWTDEHDKDDSFFRSSNKDGLVVIGDRAWISSRVTILPNIKIGEGVVVAAGAVVTKNINPYNVVAGIPAKIIAQRNKDLKYKFDGSHLWFI